MGTPRTPVSIRSDWACEADGRQGALTSYDYWAAIEENRNLRDKYYELKVIDCPPTGSIHADCAQLISLFVRSSHDLPKTWIVQSTNSSGTTAVDGVIQLDELRNPDTSAGFYVVRPTNNTLTVVNTFDLEVSDWQGNTTVPVTLNGRVRINILDRCFG